MRQVCGTSTGASTTHQAAYGLSEARPSAPPKTGMAAEGVERVARCRRR